MGEDELLDVVQQIAFAHAVEHDIPESTAFEFLKELVSLRSVGPEESARMAVRLWSSTAQLCGKELCVLANKALWADSLPAICPAVRLLLSLCPSIPESNLSMGHADSSQECWHVFRASSLLDSHREFFSLG